MQMLDQLDYLYAVLVGHWGFFLHRKTILFCCLLFLNLSKFYFLLKHYKSKTKKTLTSLKALSCCCHKDAEVSGHKFCSELTYYLGSSCCTSHFLHILQRHNFLENAFYIIDSNRRREQSQPLRISLQNDEISWSLLHHHRVLPTTFLSTPISICKIWMVILNKKSKLNILLHNGTFLISNF